MDFKGSFSKYKRNLLNRDGKIIAERNAFSFQLRDVRSFFSRKMEVIAHMSDFFNTRQQQYQYVTERGNTYTFNPDTVGWEWAQGDKMLLTDMQGNRLGAWIFYLYEYGPGECPECHGTSDETRKCKACRGQGYYRGGYLNTEIYKCNVCHGTSICQTCYVPVRNDKFGQPLVIPKKPKGMPRPPHKVEEDIQKLDREIMNVRSQMGSLVLQGAGKSSGAYQKLQILFQRKQELEGERVWYDVLMNL